MPTIKMVGRGEGGREDGPHQFRSAFYEIKKDDAISFGSFGGFVILSSERTEGAI